MKTFIKLIIFVAITICAFNQSTYAEEKIKIGLIVPLSGDNFLIGEKIIKSIRMAINKINDEKIEIIPKDTKSNPIDALKVSKELYEDGVRIIIGPVFNESTGIWKSPDLWPEIASRNAEQKSNREDINVCLNSINKSNIELNKILCLTYFTVL